MKPHIFRLRDNGQTWWVISHATGSVPGAFREPLRQLVRRFEKVHGKPAGGYVRVQGTCRPSEAAAQLADLREGGGR